MKEYLAWCWILTCIFFPGDLISQEISYSSNHKYPIKPAFEKVYVRAHDLVNMPDGLYYYDECGYATKVTTVLGDEDGTYLLLVNYQCPLCGRTYTNKTPDENYGCLPFLQNRNFQNSNTLKPSGR